ncbi:AMP-binding protein [Candidatus Sumerlaeota bacterium]|nr:AMP-binding protein [Candidatus Sumerlaeota bacterium]
MTSNFSTRPPMANPFPIEVPEFYNFAADVIDRWAEDPAKLAMLWVDARGENERRMTFAELRDKSRALAGALQHGGLHRGDRVAIVIGREPAWWIGMIALNRAGMVAVPGTTLLTPKDFKFRIEMAGIKGVIADDAAAEKVDAIRAECPGLKTLIVAGKKRIGWTTLDDIFAENPKCEPVRTRGDEPCLNFFTSGTTGHPKMVVHTHVSYPLGHYVTGKAWLGLTPADLHWNLSDTGWAKAAWSSLFGPWSLGAAVFVQQAAPKFDARDTLQVLRKFPITTFCAPPTAYRALVTLDLKERPFKALRDAVAAGEPLNPEVIAVWKEATGITIRDGYGQTETVVLAGNFPGNKIKPGSMGLPAPGFEIDVIDHDLKPLPPNKEGDIAVRVKPVRPVGLFAGYENNPGENADKFRGEYYLTGDRATRDEEGYLWFVGRSDDVILSAGYRIGPFEVESALIEHPAVQESAVVASPDPDRYEIVKAFIILKPGFSPSDALAKEIQDHVKRVTAPYKYPREIEFVESLPKTISGKIRRVELREGERKRKTKT